MPRMLPVLLGGDANVYGMARSFYECYGVRGLAVCRRALPALAHTAPTPVGMVVHCDCELTAVEDRRLHFTARVYDDVTEIAAATHERYIVDNERFTRKANSKLTAQS